VPAMRGVFAIMVSLCAACGPGAKSDPEGGGGGGDGGGGGVNEFADAAPIEACTKIDFVFVIDNSGSMAEEQGNLATNFPQFIDIIDQYTTADGAPLDYRVAITSTGRDVSYQVAIPGSPFPPIAFTEEGEDGAFQQRCTMARRWLERGDADVSGTFGCAARLGTEGPGIEMPLYAIELALGDRVADGTNAGFLRDDALLAIVILTDENDCSRRDDNFDVSSADVCENNPALVPTQEIVDFLDTVKDARGRWATAVIAGPGPGQCTSAFGDAAEATRLREFVGLTGTNAIFSSICEGDLAGALGDAIDTFDAACQTFPDVD
jgi:hypothetical protein